MTGKGKPTQEQIKEFWEKLGVKPHKEYEGFDWIWTYPEIDLNNLFKYAVPKLSFIELATGYFAGQSGNFRAQVRIASPSSVYPRLGSASAKDPVLALFWAIWEVIHA